MSRKQPKAPEEAPSRWPHRLAWVLVCFTFPLIWVGGTVTTYEAGMAVPGWPDTYDHWLWAPLSLWWPVWDMFLEHGHRLIAQSVGLLSIALTVAIWRTERRKWMRWLAIAVVAGVVFQGTLGGLRVVGGKMVRWFEETDTTGVSLVRWTADDVLLRKAHGCTAPLFFALCASMVAMTSPRWRRPGTPQELPDARRLRRLRWWALASTVGVYLLIVLGAQLRHLPIDGGSGFAVWGWIKFLSAGQITIWFTLWVWLKVILAGLVAMAVVWLWWQTGRHARGQRMLVRRARWLAGLMLVQLLLAAGTWVTNYGWPLWFTDHVWALNYTVVAEGRLQVLFTTAHTAIASLILVAGLSMTIWTWRMLSAGTGERN